MSDDSPKSILIIDDDLSMLGLLRAAIKQLNIEDVFAFSEATAAWEFLADHTVEFVILDWKLPEISGLALFNRLRSMPNLKEVPIVVVSGYLQADDFALMDELPFTTLVEKPINGFFLCRRIKEIFRDWRWYQEETDSLNEAIARLDSGDPERAQELIKLVMRAPRPMSVGIYASRMLSEKRLFTEAEELLERLLIINPDSLIALTELGKVKLKTGRFVESLGLLRKADKISPENVNRLCLLGDVSMQMLDSEQAEGYFQRALDIDSDSEKAAAGIDLAKNLEGYLGSANVTKIPSNFASLLNAIGISMVRNGQVDEGIKHYQSAMNYVEEKIAKAKLAFNLGLAHLRTKKHDDAKQWFNEAVTLSNGELAKAQHYSDKLSNRPNVKIEPSFEASDIGAVAYSDESSMIFVEETMSPKPVSIRYPASGDADVFEQIKPLIKGLKTENDDLFRLYDQESLSVSYTAYEAVFEHSDVAVFLPRSCAPRSISRMTMAEARSLGIMVLRSLGDGKWSKVWPGEEDNFESSA